MAAVTGELAQEIGNERAADVLFPAGGL